MGIEATNLERIAIIGGGPAGTSCALTLLRGARERGREIEVLLVEPKRFGEHYNQCAGVLTVDESLKELMEELGLQFPYDLVQRIVRGYVVHAQDDQILLVPREGDSPVGALRRVQFDEFLLNEAAHAGAVVLPYRMVDLEFQKNRVIIYTEGGTYYADVVVGAFGLDTGAASVFARRSAYRPPPSIETLVTKIHPAGLEPIEGLLEDHIHAFLPRLPQIEFGALVPKGNHISIIIAGRGLAMRDMQRFLAMPQVSPLLPEGTEPGDCFRGTFPVGLAHRFFGQRYLIAGDAAGLVRPFKGGGIAAALKTGRLAGRTLLAYGVTAQAGAAYMAECRDLRGDVRYGQVLRWLVALLSGPFRMEAIIHLAHQSRAMQQALYDCVSGRTSYRQIFREELTPSLVAQAAWACITWPLRGRRDRPV